MKRVLLIAAVSVLMVSADWSNSSGNPQRDGWLRSEDQLSRESAAAGDIKLLYSAQLDPKPQRLGSPVMLSNFISYKGFKALVFIGGNSDVYAVDYQLAKPYFRTHLDQPSAAATELCPGGISVVLAGGSTSVARHPLPTPPVAGRSTAKVGANVWAVGADGYLQTLREQDGDNKVTAPVKFLPANSRASDLTMVNGVIFAATQNECGGNPNALYAVDVSSPEKTVVSFPAGGSGFAGSGGVAASTDNSTVYGMIASKNTVLALDAKSLAVKDSFTPADAGDTPGATPAVFVWNGRDVIVSSGTDGRVYLLDSAALHTPLARSEVVAGIRNAFATWIDPVGNTRWIYASIADAIVGFTVDDAGGSLKLTQRWKSRSMVSPAAPAVTNGLVFALSTGQGKMPKNAVLYGLDSSTGREIWSSGGTATSYATGGLAVNASTILFATHDSQLHAYGVPIIF